MTQDKTTAIETTEDQRKLAVDKKLNDLHAVFDRLRASGTTDPKVEKAVTKTLATVKKLDKLQADYDRLRAAGAIEPIAFMEDKTPGTPR